MPDSLPATLRSTLRVLVIEDEQRYRRLLLDVLSGMDCEPIGVPTASDAFREIAQAPPDMVLLDLNLPVMDGMSFLERFRRKHAHTPVIILTGVGTLASAQHAIRFGVTDFLTKPCHLGNIEAALDRARRRLADSQGTSATRDDASQCSTGTDDEGDPPPTISALERQAILDALARNGGNRTAAAAELGISRRTLYNRLANYRHTGQLP